MSTTNATDAASIIANLPPPSQDTINLAFVDVIASALMFLVAGWVAWKHGKAGMVCWQIVIMAPIAQIVAGVYLIVNKDKPLIPSAVSTMTASAVLACISLGLIGIIYECNTILPNPPKTWKYKIILGVTHLSNTAGIGMATYGGAPDAAGAGGVKNAAFEQLGTLMMLWVLFAVCGWMWPTWRRIQRASNHSQLYHPNARPARMLFFGAAAAMPFWVGHMGYLTLYAFQHTPSLAPVMGSFATKLVLLFLPYLGAMAGLLAGGALAAAGGGLVLPVGLAGETLSGEEDERGLYREGTNGSSDVEMSVRKR